MATKPTKIPLVAGSRIKLGGTIKDQDGVVVDLTGGTVQLKYKIGSGSVQTKSASITTPAAGTVEYEFGSSELTSGILKYEWVFTDAASKPFTSSDVFIQEVRPVLV